MSPKIALAINHGPALGTILFSVAMMVDSSLIIIGPTVPPGFNRGEGDLFGNYLII